MRRARRLCATVAALVLVLAPAAGAEVRQGAGEDPVGDGPDTARDITALSASYDTSGSVKLTATLAAAPDAGTSATLFAYVGIEDAEGFCRRPFLVLQSSTVAGGDTVWSDDGATAQPASKTVAGAAVTVSMSAPGVAGRAYTCAGAALYDPSSTAADAKLLDAIGSFSIKAPSAPPPPPSPTTTPTTIYGICGHDLCRVDPATQKVTRLARGTTKARYDAVSASPSGTVVAFARGGTIYRAQRDGKQRVSWGSGSRPAVRADGRAIAWLRGKPATLLTRTLTARKPRTVKRGVSTFAWLGNRLIAGTVVPGAGSPAGSPDGRHVAVVAKGRIDIHDAGGKLERSLTTGTHPIFSPDSTQVAFNRGTDLYVVAATGGTPVLVTKGLKLTGPSWAKSVR